MSSSYPEVSRLETRSRSRDLGLQRDRDSSTDWRDSMGYLMNAFCDGAEEEDLRRMALTRGSAGSTHGMGVPAVEGRLSEMSLNEAREEILRERAEEKKTVVVTLPKGPSSTPSSTPSSDYLLALSSSGGSSTKRAPSFDDARSRGNSNEIYAEMLSLLEDEDELDFSRRLHQPQLASVAEVPPEAPPPHQQKKPRKPREKKPKAKSETLVKKAPRPIAPKPEASASTPTAEATDSRASLQRRVVALFGVGRVSRTQADEAKAVAQKADSFILNHLDDALAELEAPVVAQQKQNETKLGLLLEIYASVHAYMEDAPPSKKKPSAVVIAPTPTTKKPPHPTENNLFQRRPKSNFNDDDLANFVLDDFEVLAAEVVNNGGDIALANGLAHADNGPLL